MSYSADATRYDAMNYRRCGASGLDLPAVSLAGLPQFVGIFGVSGGYLAWSEA
jgi:L-glyceraldehyde 3-phosphate reductase